MNTATTVAVAAAKMSRRQTKSVIFKRGPLRYFKLLFQRLVRSFIFWTAVALFSFAEPVLCSYYPTRFIIYVQTGVLGISTVLYIIQLIGVATTEWEKIFLVEAAFKLRRASSMESGHRRVGLSKLWKFFTSEGEYILEGFFLSYGWTLLHWKPGLAALRCFRVFRILWFYEIDVFRNTIYYYFSPIIGEVFINRAFKVLKFAVATLTALASELFRLTSETRGGLLLIMVFFYSAYVLGAAVWVETNAELIHCNNLGTCVYTLLRLTFFDGNGFDFAAQLTIKHKALFILVMVYMAITAFGILNGLVGIFGSIIANASNQAFEDEKGALGVKEYDKLLDEDSSSEEDLSSDGEDNDGADNSEKRSAYEDKATIDRFDSDIIEENVHNFGGDDLRSVKESHGIEKSGHNLSSMIKAQKSTRNLFKRQASNFAKEYIAQMQLEEGKTSTFSMDHLIKLQEEAKKSAQETTAQDHRSSHGKSKFHQLVRKATESSKIKESVVAVAPLIDLEAPDEIQDFVPDDKSTAIDSSNLQSHHSTRDRAKTPPKSKHDPLALFSNPKASTHNPKHDAHLHPHGRHGETMEQLHDMKKTLDRQNEMILAMYTQISYLSKQIQAANPSLDLEDKMPDIHQFSLERNYCAT